MRDQPSPRTQTQPETTGSGEPPLPATNGHRRETTLAYGGMVSLLVLSLALTYLAYRQYEATRTVEPWIAAAVTLIVRELSGIVRWYEQRY